MTCDTLGNLTSDSSRGLWHMSYDYRNLLDSVAFETPPCDDNYPSVLRMQYDQTGMRIREWYSYWGPGGLGGGMMGAMGGGFDPCQVFENDTTELMVNYLTYHLGSTRVLLRADSTPAAYNTS